MPLQNLLILGEQRFFIIAEATDRFRLEEVDSLASTPYTTARVTWLDERDGDVTALASLADRLRAELVAFREVTGVEAEDVPGDARGLSYAVPLVVGLGLADRQHLLESPDTESRLRLGLQLTQRERELASALGGALKPPDSPFDLN